MTRKLDLFGGTTAAITAWTHSTGASGEVIITDIDGWDDGVSITRNSSNVLWEHGEAQSTNALYSARRITIELVTSGDEAQLLAFREKLVAIGRNLNTLRLVRVTTFAENGDELLREELSCRPDAEFFDWSRKGDTVTVAIYLIAPQPLKTTYKNGGSTPVAGGTV